MINCCVNCSSPNYVRNGHDKEGVQRYKCCECKRRFCEKGIFARHRYPVELIMDAIFLYSQPISTRGVVRNLKRFRKIEPSHVSVYNWVIKFASYIIKIASIKPLNFSNEWHCDEKFIRVRKSRDPFAYLWIVSDSNSNIITTHVSFRRNIESAKIVFEKAKQRTGFLPEIMVTDGLQAYKKACKKSFGKNTRHVVAHFEPARIVHKKKLMKLSNNIAERINQFPALRLHAIRGFKRLNRANLLIEFFTIYYNYLMPHGEKEEVKVQWERVPTLINR
ncbi:MAG: DDE-type integrase/transposase/recombinase [Nanoarchaeota archaeon]